MHARILSFLKPFRLEMVLLTVLAFACPAQAGAGPRATAKYVASDTIASIKEDGNVIFYSRHSAPNRLPITMENLKFSDSVTAQTEMIDIRDSEDRFLRFKQNVEGGWNKIEILPNDPIPVGGSIGLFTVSLHKDLVRQGDGSLVFEYVYTPDSATNLKFSAVIPPTATATSVEPEPSSQTERKFCWEYQLEANQPFACRIKYKQEAPFGMRPITGDEDLTKFATSTMWGWRDSSVGIGWGWFTKSGKHHGNLMMPHDCRISINMKTLSTSDSRRRFGLMLDSTNISDKLSDDREDPWGKVAYSFFWSNCDTDKGYAYGLIRDGILVASKKAPEIELNKDYQVALEREGNRFRFFIDGKKTLEYEDPQPLWTPHPLKFGVHGPLNGEELEKFWTNPKNVNRGREILDKRELTAIAYANPNVALIGWDEARLEYLKYLKPVNSIDFPFQEHVFSRVSPIFYRINGCDGYDFPPADCESVEEVADIDLSKLGLTKISSEPLKKAVIGKIKYDVPREEQPFARLLTYAREGSADPVLFIEMGRAPDEMTAYYLSASVRGQENWGAYNGADFSQAFYPHQASMAMRKGRWLFHVSVPLEEGTSEELEGKVDTIRLFMRQVAAEILMHFYEMDMQEIQKN